MKTLTVVLIFVSFFGSSLSLYKRWQKDTNFENPQNWNLKRLPETGDTVIIPDDSPVVYIQLNTTIKELILPKDGELVLGQDLDLGFDAPDSGSDQSAEVEFSAVNPVPWFAPSSWCTPKTERGECDNGTLLLDVEQVPCAYDDVVFPPQHSFYVDLREDVPNMKVKSLKISGNSFSTSTLSTFMNGREGQLMFKMAVKGNAGKAGLKLTRKSCDDKRGCACGNDKPEIAKKICAYKQKSCNRPKCQQALQATGGCCRFCGAIFNVTKGYGFSFNDFKSILQKDVFDKAKDVSVITSPMSAGWVQIVLMDPTGRKSAKMADDVKAVFDEDLRNGGHKFAIDAFKLDLSLATHGPSSQSGSKAMSGLEIFGIIFGIIVGLLLIALIVVVFVYRRSGRPLPALPSMLPRPSMPNLFSQRRRPRSNRPRTAAHVDPGFANPMFDSGPFDDDVVVKEMSDMSSDVTMEQPTFDKSGGFNNPLYHSKRTKNKFKDPSSVNEATSSGVAAMPTSGASTGPAPSATGMILDLGDGVPDTDSSI